MEIFPYFCMISLRVTKVRCQTNKIDNNSENQNSNVPLSFFMRTRRGRTGEVSFLNQFC